MKRLLQLAVLAVSLLISTESFATGVLKLDLAPTPDAGNFILSGSVFGTRGTQTTNVSFASSLAALAPLSGAQFDLSSVDVLSPLVVDSAPQSAKTSGGDFALYAADQTLLLNGHLGEGLLSVAFDADTGSYFNLAFGTFTGGTLAHLFAPNTLGVSIALTNFRSLGAIFSNSAENYLLSDGSVVIRGHDADVPEPASVFLFGMGIIGAALVRRHRTTE